jgi:hypothetical protein
MRLLFQKLVNTYKLENEQYVQFNQENLRNKFLLVWILALIKLNSFKNGKSIFLMAVYIFLNNYFEYILI